MGSLVQTTFADLGLSPQALVMIGMALGGFLAILGVAGAFSGPRPVLERIARQRPTQASGGLDAGLLRPSDNDPKGLMKSLIPTDKEERSQVQRMLAQAGVTGPHALRNYYLVRLVLGFVLPAAAFTLIAMSRAGMISLPGEMQEQIGSMDQKRLMLYIGILVAIGFFGPVYWLRGKVAARQREIDESFPNVLDLLQISVESGLGLDAAMIRVANETVSSAPAISAEFMIAQREIQAGRNRERALLDMATRSGVAQVASFANVVLQSLQFGNSISEALAIYSDEMRTNRELRAQEMANKLPVKMSAVMACMMLPALLMLALGPVVIRYVRYMHG